MSENQSHDRSNDIAIVGMHCRVPGATNVEEFWRNLQSGTESIRFFSESELESAGVDREVFRDARYVKACASLEDIDLFDAAFFGYTPREAEAMDPQHRIFLECAWEVLERSGYLPEQYPGAIGVFAGASPNTYLLKNLLQNQRFMRSTDPLALTIGNNPEGLVTRLAYKLNLRGPAIAVQSACSTSLVAIHMAVQSLLSGECDMALAGGVSLILPQNQGYIYQPEGIFSPDGHCRPFCKNAQGMIGGRGAGIVLLKRYTDAISDRDRVHCVIRGSAVNNDGSSKVGYTAPSIKGQAAVIAEAMAVAEVDPFSISYVEAHGTGTSLGDPIEIAALTQAFREQTDAKHFCAVGSVKSNIGHLDAAAGVVGLIKAALALKHKQIPPSINFAEPNPELDLESSPFYICNQLTEWQSDKRPRRAGVSSFGIGGTNAHVVLEETPKVAENQHTARAGNLLLLSARTPEALEQASYNLRDQLQASPRQNLADVEYTLQISRKHFDHRRMLVCNDSAGAISALQNVHASHSIVDSSSKSGRTVAFMFPGQGAQYIGMGQGLYQTEKVFRDNVDLCREILKPLLGLDLLDCLYPDQINQSTAAKQLNETRITQPALFAIEYATAQLLMSWGIRPSAMIGHSVGEYVAACLAGVFSLKDSLRLVAERGSLMQRMPRGAMLAVLSNLADIHPFLDNRLSVASINAPNQVVVSGPTNEINDLQQKLQTAGMQSKQLQTSHAFHSSMMEGALNSFLQFAEQIEFQEPRIPYVSNVTGTWITPEEVVDSRYWANHLRNTVNFADGLHQIAGASDILLEVGPAQTLTSLAQQQCHQGSECIVIPTMRRNADQTADRASLLDSLGRLWLAGVDIDWQACHQGQDRQRVELPTYPFERQRYWIDADDRSLDEVASAESHQKNPNISDWFYYPSWKRSTHTQRPDDMDQENWLLFMDEIGFGAAFADQLRELGQCVTTVVAGTSFQQVSMDAYVVQAENSENYGQLLQLLQANGRTPNRIVHLWGVHNPNGTLEERTNRSQVLLFQSLLSLAQTLGSSRSPTATDVTVVTTDLHDVTGHEALAPEKAISIGPMTVIPQEYEHITCRGIDFSSGSQDARQGHTQNWKTQSDQLLQEIRSPTTEPLVAYRGQHRWLRSIDPILLPENQAEPVGLREKGVYLITGGLGGIGFALADYLATEFQAKLVLTSRKGLPAPATWADWLSSHAPDDPISIKLRKLQDMQSRGAEVWVVAADVADRTQMKNVVDETLERFGAIHGVIHASGIAGGGIIQLKSSEDAHRVMHPKVQGTHVLSELLEQIPLDFFAICSSAASLIGGVGQVDYCAANAYEDAFAIYRNQDLGKRTISIDWDTWSDVGMAVDTDIPVTLQAERDEALRKGIRTQEGIDAFARAISTQLPQVIVSTREFQPRLMASGRSQQLTLVEQTPDPEAQAPKHNRPNMSSEYVAPATDSEQALAEIWRDLLGFERIGIHDNFLELGGNSLIAVQMLARLTIRFDNVEISLRELFNKPTISQLAKQFNCELRHDVSSLNKRGGSALTTESLDEMSEDDLDALF